MRKDIENISLDIINSSANGYLLLEKEHGENEKYYAVYTNRMFEKMFHISLEELEEIEFFEFLDDVNFKKDKLLQIVHLVIRNNKVYREILYSYKYSKYLYVTMFRINESFFGATFSDTSDYQDNIHEINELHKQRLASDEELRYQLNLLTAAREKLTRNEEIYKLISSKSNEGFKYINHNTGVRMTSAKWYEMFNIDKKEEDNERLFFDAICDEDRTNISKCTSMIIEEKIGHFETEFKINNGKTWIHCTGVSIFDNTGKCEEQIFFYSDITELKNKQIELEYMAFYDPQTGMYNRHYFMNELENAVKKANKDNLLVQVMDIDLDNFKRVNDTIGFVLGDELIIAFSKIIREFESEVVKVGRLSNDEFAIALYDAPSENSAEILYKNLKKRLERPICLSNGVEIYLNISAGIASYPEGGSTATDILKCADIAMLHVKDNGKNGMAVFERNMLNTFLNNVLIEQKLKNAMEKENFYLCYQPQYDAITKNLRGFEALIRWKDIQEGMISPAVFIPIAERMGYILKIGNWVIKESLKTLAKWKKEFHYKGVMSINISALQLKDSRFVENLLYHVRLNNLRPSDIELEITETVFIDDYKIMIEVLEVISHYGFKISLDDFGTGYSSLSYLKNIPINTLKIDKTFIDSMITDEATSIIIHSLIDMVRKLGLETIAEGVETQEQYNFLKIINCDNIQGYYLAHPMEEKDISEILKSYNK